MTSLENSTDNRVVSGCEGYLDKPNSKDLLHRRNN